MLNETIQETINALTPQGVLWWIKILALFGAFWLLQTLLKTGMNLIYFIAYLYGGIVFIISKIKKQKDKV